VTYLRGGLSVVAAILVALLAPGLVAAFWNVSTTKATGLTFVTAGFLESLLSPLFWILAILFFALFFAAGQINSKPLRILLFWTPVSTILTMGFSILAFFTYIWLHFRKG
jgi:hypothetical protein